MAELIFNSTLETIYMIVLSSLISYLFGIPLGVLLLVTGEGEIMEMKLLNKVLGFIVNVFRSIPFVILIIYLADFTKLIVGTKIGPTASVVGLTVAAIPFVSRMVENTIKEVDHSVIEIASQMGASKWQVITKVMLKEAMPSIIRGGSITAITLVGYSAMAGTIGGGGLGSVAINYGLYKFDFYVMTIVLIVIVALVQLLQLSFNFVSKKIDKNI